MGTTASGSIAHASTRRSLMGKLTRGSGRGRRRGLDVRKISSTYARSVTGGQQTEADLVLSSGCVAVVLCLAQLLKQLHRRRPPPGGHLGKRRPCPAVPRRQPFHQQRPGQRVPPLRQLKQRLISPRAGLNMGQGIEIVRDSLAFVNRRSRVQIPKVAPGNPK